MANIPSLPADLIQRPATREDAIAIAAINAAHEVAAGQEPLSVPLDLYDLWDNHDVDLATDTLVLCQNSGDLVAYTALCSNLMIDPNTTVHMDYLQQGLEDFLYQFIVRRAQAMLAQDATLEPRLWAYSFSETSTADYQQRGFTLRSSDWRMRIDFDDSLPQPQPIPGITIRPYQPGDEHEVHTVICEAFKEIPLQPIRTFEEWHKRVFTHTAFDPAIFYVALVGEQVVGVVHGRLYPEDPSHISQVAVARAFRRRGIARQLLLHIFHAYRQRGTNWVELDVAVANPTGAHECYASAGMRRWTRVDCVEQLLTR